MEPTRAASTAFCGLVTRFRSLPVDHFFQILFLLGDFLELFLLFLEDLGGDARRVRLRTQQQIPEFCHEPRAIFLKKTRECHLQLARIERVVHFGLEQVDGHGHDDLVFKSQKLGYSLSDPLMNDFHFYLAQVHFLVKVLGEFHFGQKLLVLVEVATVLVDTRSLDSKTNKKKKKESIVTFRLALETERMQRRQTHPKEAARHGCWVALEMLPQRCGPQQTWLEPPIRNGRWQECIVKSHENDEKPNGKPEAQASKKYITLHIVAIPPV